MNLSRKIVILRLAVSLVVFAYLGYSVYKNFYLQGQVYEFTVLASFFTLYLFWAALSQFRFHRIAAFATVLEKDERTYLLLQVVHFLIIFMALLDFAALDVSRFRSLEPEILLAGIAIFLVACLVRWWAYASIGDYFSPRIALYKEHQLITRGAYRRIRHPLYLGMLLELIAVACMFSSGVAVLLIAMLAVPAVFYRIRLEEAMLAESFAGEFDDYCRQSKKLIPFIF